MPHRRNRGRMLWSLSALAVALWGNFAGAGQPYASRHENVLGTTLDLVIRADRPEAADRAETAVLAEIDRLAAILSTWDGGSEFSRWHQGPQTPVSVSPELFEVLGLCDKWRVASGGAFNAGAQAVCKVWKEGARIDRVPAAAELEQAVERAGSPHWKLDRAARTAHRLTDCPLTLDALAKGYIVECAAAAAMKKIGDLQGIVVAIGGDLRVLGPDAHEVQITDPSNDADNAPPIARIAVRNKAVATSGGYRRGVRIGGSWYSHIVDPRTGMPVDHIASSTAIADHAADADALATIFNVLPVEESLRLADATPGVACLLMTREGKTFASERWREFSVATEPDFDAADSEEQTSDSATVALAQTTKKKPASSAKGKADSSAKSKDASKKTNEAGPDDWPADFEMLVQFEVDQAKDGRRYRRPYIAVWIENADAAPIRTLAVWYRFGQGERWIPDLRRWHRADKKRRETDERDVLAIASGATRNPGKYKLVWDGKDDAGKPVANGKYTVLIEAAREHGTYQLIKDDVEVTGKPFTHDLKDNVEIKGASLDYRRKSASAAGK